MCDILTTFLVSLGASLIAVLIALWVEKRRLPKLMITASEQDNVTMRYAVRHWHAGENWKYLRVSVYNKSFPHPFRWITRQTAMNCKARLDFYGYSSRNHLFTMDGRWISTPQMPYLDSNEARLRLLYPDPVTIPIDSRELLDVVAQCETETEAFGWNNEAYFNNWRTTPYQLDIGEYFVKVSVFTQNGITFSGEFRLMVSENIEATSLQSIDRN